MLVSMNWLRDYVPGLVATAQELEEKMSTTGIEVEGVIRPDKELSKLVVGEILSAEPIPETHLQLTKVVVSADETLQIVCGAPNVVVGNKAIVAEVGARIGEGVKIKKGKIRGVESQGMLCALDEIGVSDKINPMKHEEGIFVMPADSVIGESVLPYLGMDDEILDLSITPNRADALSMHGVAYEVAAIYGLTVKFPEVTLTESAKAAAGLLSVKVDTDKVPTYTMRLIENLTVAASPQWLQNRLMAAGVKPINNVVDATNYILMDCGQPLHAFDFAKLQANEILVRAATDGEKITTIDHENRELSASDLVITAGGKPVALAGVMGGADSEISDATTTVALEAALFDGTSIRKTAQKFALHSEASQRFEKGVNEGTVRAALDAAAALIIEIAGGQILSGIVASNDYEPILPKVSITLSRVNQVLGTNLSVDEVALIFHQLGFGLTMDGETFTCEIPSRRWDIAIEADLIEEIARIYGYDRLPVTLPAGNEAGSLTDIQRFRRKMRGKLEAAGLSEIIGYSLMSPEKALEFVADKTFPTTSLMLPMTEDRQTLRVNMIPGLLDTIAYNQNRKNADVSIYEIGNIFLPSADGSARPQELQNIAFAISGNVTDKTYEAKPVPVDFYYVKGIVEQLLAGIPDVTFTATDAIPPMHPGRTAVIQAGERHIGFVGQIHPATAKKYGIAETYAAGLDLEATLALQPSQTIFEEITKFPAVSRDMALLVDEATTHAEILDAINAAKVKTLIKTELFDLYEGDNLPAGKKSMAYSLTFQNRAQTMTDEEILSAMTKIERQLTEKLQVEIR